MRRSRHMSDAAMCARRSMISSASQVPSSTQSKLTLDFGGRYIIMKASLLTNLHYTCHLISTDWKRPHRPTSKDSFWQPVHFYCHRLLQQVGRSFSSPRQDCTWCCTVLIHDHLPVCLDIELVRLHLVLCMYLFISLRVRYKLYTERSKTSAGLDVLRQSSQTRVGSS